jgi:hypothetical protein
MIDWAWSYIADRRKARLMIGNLDKALVPLKKAQSKVAR